VLVSRLVLELFEMLWTSETVQSTRYITCSQNRKKTGKLLLFRGLQVMKYLRVHHLAEASQHQLELFVSAVVVGNSLHHLGSTSAIL
jgi:hypothetical protein